jgi:hypothetical protein
MNDELDVMQAVYPDRYPERKKKHIEYGLRTEIRTRDLQIEASWGLSAEIGAALENSHKN